MGTVLLSRSCVLWLGDVAWPWGRSICHGHVYFGSGMSRPVFHESHSGGMMITISVCMIVKDEAVRLGKCLDSLVSIADEIIVVDTGSTDETKAIASKYTDKVFDFEWTGNFSDARNYAFSKATCDYIYSADADEELDADNIRKFRLLKEAMDTRVDIVQMYYCNQLQNNTIYSFDRELRPKMYKRIRQFVWEDAIHEAVRLDPVIYNSEIDIIHNPGPGHGKRDLAAFEKLVAQDELTSDRLIELYAKELIIAGEKADFLKAREFFCGMCESDDLDDDMLARVLTIAAVTSMEADDIAGFMKYTLRAAAVNSLTSELCCYLGHYYEALGDCKEAIIWYYNAANETESYMDIRYQNEIPNEALKRLQK